jgi:hypothetical protein
MKQMGQVENALSLLLSGLLGLVLKRKKKPGQSGSGQAILFSSAIVVTAFT